MAADTIFTELSLVIAIAAAMALIMRLIRQPLIIGHILTGIIVGPSLLHLIKAPATIESFSNIGIALLLFIVGLGLNPRVIKEVGKVAGITALVQVGLTLAIGWSAARLLGETPRQALLIGIGLSFSSTIIILKLLSDKKEQTRLYGKITIGLLLIQDLLAMAALLWVTALQGNHAVSLHNLGVLGLKGLVILLALFIIGWAILPRIQKFIAGSQELLFLFAIGYGFGAAALFYKIGGSIEVGALLAGISLASLPYTQAMSARLRPLRDFFVVVFFIYLGTQLSVGTIIHLIPLIVVGSLIVIILKPLITLTTMGLLGYTKNTGFKTALAIGQVSEFSLVLFILANRRGLIPGNLVSALTIIALLTIAVSTYLTIYNDQLTQFFDKALGLFERSHTHFDRQSRNHYDMVLFGYSKGGHEFLKVFKSLERSFAVIDYDPEVVEILEHQKAHVMYGDASDLELLEEAGLDKTRLVVSTISDFKTNSFLTELLHRINEDCVVIVHADTASEATQLYDMGATYVMLPLYIGSEKISAFIRRNGFSKHGFKIYREKHLAYLRQNYSLESEA